MRFFNDLREVLGTMKHTKLSAKTITVCPKCASPKIHLATGFEFWLTPGKYVCDNCGYHGVLVMELEKIEEDHQVTENKSQ